METQTYSLFQALSARGSREALDLLLALLHSSGSVEELAERTGVSSPTASRRLDDLALVGVVSRPRPRGAYELTRPEETRKFLEAASALATAVLESRLESETQLSRRIRKSRLRPQDSSSNGEEKPA